MRGRVTALRPRPVSDPGERGADGDIPRGRREARAERGSSAEPRPPPPGRAPRSAPALCLSCPQGRLSGRPPGPASPPPLAGPGLKMVQKRTAELQGFHRSFKVRGPVRGVPLQARVRRRGEAHPGGRCRAWQGFLHWTSALEAAGSAGRSPVPCRPGALSARTPPSPRRRLVAPCPLQYRSATVGSSVVCVALSKCSVPAASSPAWCCSPGSRALAAR